MALNISIIPKWVWIVLAVAVGLGIVGAGYYAVHTYQNMATKLADETAAKNDALGANKNLQSEIDRLKQDELDRAAANAAIAADSKAVRDKVKSVSAELDAAIAERDKAKALAEANKDRTAPSVACPIEEALSVVPNKPDLGLTYAWKTFCELTPGSPQCAPQGAVQ